VLSQERIYDERYRQSAYDERSVARVLTAESTALRNAVHRALDTNPNDPVTLLDFGYGTGRVTNEFLLEYHKHFGRYGRGLTVVAYDVSTVGLKKAADGLSAHGFAGGADLDWQPRPGAGHVIGSIDRKLDGVAVRVVFVHGNETEHPAKVRNLLIDVNDGRQYLVTTSWYSALGHISGAELRRQFFVELGEITLPSGELIVAVASTGDLVDAQKEWAELRAAGRVNGFPIECDGDVLYLTELGQENYWHVFGTDLDELLGAVCPDGQTSWIEAIRSPDEEFATIAAEQANYAKVVAFNRRKVGTRWTPDDYRAMHTVAAVRSAPRLPIPDGGYSSNRDAAGSEASGA